MVTPPDHYSGAEAHEGTFNYGTYKQPGKKNPTATVSLSIDIIEFSSSRLRST